MGKNKIESEGCRVIAMLLANESSSLKTLGLSHTGIGDEGAEIIASSLTHNTTLYTLYLYDNGITEGASE